MALFLIVGQAHFVINNIFEGFIWFILPVSMVITNDIFAYLCGITFGRTPLIQISPKKTWEGFLGAWFFTILWGIGLTHFLAQWKYFICPVNVGVFISSRFKSLTGNRTSAQTSGRASSASPTQSSSRVTTLYLSSLTACPFPALSTSCPCSSTSSSSPPLRLLLHHLEVSSPLG